MSRSEISTANSMFCHSVTEFADAIANTKKCKGTDNSSTSNSRSRQWDRDLGFEGAMAMANDGGFWPEGAATMKHKMDIVRDMFAVAPQPMLERAVSGFVPCVAAAVMGHPMAMYRHSDQAGAGKPIISIGISMISSGGLDGEDRFNQGAAVLAAIEELEMRGYRCELVSVYRTGPNNRKPIAQWSNIEVTIKQADQAFNPVAVAFALAHPAWLRRLGFAAIERTQNGKEITHAGYGDARGGDRWDESMAGDFDIVVPNICGSEYHNVESAFDTVTDIFNRAMKKLTGEI